MTGHLFGDRYQVGDTLGFGGMSEVHRGRDLRLGRDVAIKVLRADLARDPSFQVRFRREAQNAASLNHPAIVAVYDTGETQGENGPIPYIVMEYVDGETLRDVLKREGQLSPTRAMEIVADVCAALDFSHRHGIVHRDIKPANVMLTRAGAVKVMDFGIARAVADGSASVTATAAVIGTAQYLSPEQARGEAVDARSDVYATGCVLFELLTGGPPFTGDSPVAIAYQHVREEPRAPSDVRPGLPKELDAIVLKALNKNPLNRYQTAAEMRSDLVRALSGQAVQATPVMSDEERTQLLRPGPVRVGAATAGPPLLAPPRRSIPDDLWEDEEDPHRTTRRVWGFVGIGLLCAVLLAGAIFFTLKVIDGNKTAAKVSVPPLRGMTQDVAVATLQQANLQVGTITTQESSDADKGKVVDQDPSSQTVVGQGQKVNLVIGKGVTTVAVPDLTGKTQDVVTQELAQANLILAVKTQDSDDANKGKAMLQDPPPGQQVPPGTTITVTFGLGQKLTAVPNGLAGKSFADAQALLTAAHLTGIEVEVPGVEPEHQVLTLTGVTVGQTVPYGTSVTLQTSDFSQFVMPDLANNSVDDAAQTLAGLQWKGDAGNITAPTVGVTYTGQIGVVVSGSTCAGGSSQSPAPGAKVSKVGTAVVVCVGTAKQITIDNVAGTPAAAAVAHLTSQGFTNVTTVKAPGPAPAGQEGNAISTNPVASSTVPFNTPIVVSVYGAAAATTPAVTTPPVVPPPGG